MVPPLGEKILDWLIIIFFACWGSMWIILLLITLIQIVFPKLEGKSENLLQKSGTIYRPIQKYLLISFGILLLIRLMGIVANWLGW